MARKTQERSLWTTIGIPPVVLIASRQTLIRPRAIQAMSLATSVAVKRHASSQAIVQASSAPHAVLADLVSNPISREHRVRLFAVGACRRIPSPQEPPAGGRSFTPKGANKSPVAACLHSFASSRATYLYQDRWNRRHFQFTRRCRRWPCESSYVPRAQFKRRISRRK